jgi:hypothetical protein
MTLKFALKQTEGNVAPLRHFEQRDLLQKARCDEKGMQGGKKEDGG